MKGNGYNEEKAQLLGDIVSNVFGADVFENTRLRPNVNARMIFSKILTDEGLSSSEIGRMLSKTHATILHYNKKLHFFLKYDQALNQKYIRCLHQYNNKSINTLSKGRLLNDIYDLKNELSKMKELYDLSKKASKEESRNEDRLLGIYKIIKDRTKMGDEDEMEIRINRLYNTIA